MLEGKVYTIDDVELEHNCTYAIRVNTEELEFDLTIKAVKTVLDSGEPKLVVIGEQDGYFFLDDKAAEVMYRSHKAEWLVNNSVLDQVEEGMESLKDFLDEYINKCVEDGTVTMKQCLEVVDLVKKGLADLEDQVNRRL